MNQLEREISQWLDAGPDPELDALLDPDVKAQCRIGGAAKCEMTPTVTRRTPECLT